MITKWATPLIASFFWSSGAQAWWMRGDAIEIYCETGVASSEPHIQSVHLKGRRLSVELEGRTRDWDTRTFQLSSHKVWDHPEIQLSVALKGWGTYHDATLIFKGDKEKFISLYCYPNKSY